VPLAHLCLNKQQRAVRCFVFDNEIVSESGSRPNGLYSLRDFIANLGRGHFENQGAQGANDHGDCIGFWSHVPSRQRQVLPSKGRRLYNEMRPIRVLQEVNASSTLVPYHELICCVNY